MDSILYDELVDWYHLLDPPAEHADEVAVYDALLAGAVSRKYRTLLELGAGAGNNARYFKLTRECTLTDLSPKMIERSRRQNPECEHAVGDMRTLRLGRTFDAVMVHDAVVHMRTVHDLRQLAATAFLHTRAGGAALFAPDCLAESFREFADDDVNTDGARTMRYMTWCWQPTPGASTYRVDYMFLLREGSDMRAVHAHHDEGLFDRATWTSVLTAAGYAVEVVRRDLGEALEHTGYTPDIFLARRPA